MEEVKLEKSQEFRRFLLDNNINYKELSLIHFHIFNRNGDLIAQVWPTTEKCSWQVAGLTSTIVGMLNIQGMILEAYKDQLQEDSLRAEFEKYKDTIHLARKLITVTELATGALEVQINDAALVSKYQYILDAYDEQMRLKSNKEIQIVEFIIV